MGCASPGDIVKRALVTGVGGQDGYYLSTLLLRNGYEVLGCGRRGTLGGSRGDELRSMGVRIIELDLLDRADTERCVRELNPSEIYNLAGHSFVPASWDDPAAAVRITSWPIIHLMEAVRNSNRSIRVYQSSTSEIFGLSDRTPQNESTQMAPANPYAAAKVFAHNVVQMYRRHYGIFAVSGILYNHESPRRPPTFVTRKVTQSAARIEAGLQSKIQLGDLDVTRDWGFAGDYVEAIWLMVQAGSPEDFVIGTGVPHTVRQLCEAAFGCLGLDYRNYVDVDTSLLRPDQPVRLLADPSHAAQRLHWNARTSFDELIRMMVEADRRISSTVSS